MNARLQREIDGRDDRCQDALDAVAGILGDALAATADEAAAALRGRADAVTAAGAPGDVDDGVCVCLTFDDAEFDDPDLPVPLPDGLTVDELHMTVVYLGKVDDFPEHTRPAVEEAVFRAAAAVLDGPVDLSGGETAHFGSDDDPQVAYVVQFLRTDNPGVYDLREAVEAELAELGVYSASEHEFTAHVTLGYYDRDDPRLADDGVALLRPGKDVEAWPWPALRHVAIWWGADETVEDLGDGSRVAASTVVAAAGDSPLPSGVAVDDVWDQARYEAALEEARPYLVEIAAAEGTLAGLAWDVTAPDVLAIADAHIEGLWRLGDQARAHLASTVEAALSNGWSIDQAARKLQAGPFDRNAAYTAARTEIISAANVAKARAIDTLGDEGDEKEWISTGDDRTRPSHRAMGGQRVPIGGYFQVGPSASLAIGPGDSALPEEERIRCRCTVVRRLKSGRVAGGSPDGAELLDDGVPVDEASLLVPTAAMAREARRALRWIESGQADTPAAWLADLGGQIAERGALAESDLHRIVATYDAAAPGVDLEGGKGGEEGFPNRWRVECSLVGGEDGAAWARRKLRQLKRAHAGGEVTEMADDVDVLEHPGTGEVMEAIEVPADGTTAELTVHEYETSTQLDVDISVDVDGSLVLTAPAGVELARIPAADWVPDGIDPQAALDTVTAGLTQHLSIDVGGAPVDVLDDMAASQTVTAAAISAGDAAGPGTSIVAAGDGRTETGMLTIGGGLVAAPRQDPEPGDLSHPWDFRSLLVVEGLETGDGRRIDLGALTWRVPPLPMMAQLETAGGHDGSNFAGSIHAIIRDGSELWGYGYWDTGEIGQEVARMVDEGTMRGVSADLDDIDIEVVWPDDDSIDDNMFFIEPELIIITRGRVCGATIVNIPAFAECFVELFEIDEDGAGSALFPAATVAAAGPRRDTLALRQQLVPVTAAAGKPHGARVATVYTPLTLAPQEGTSTMTTLTASAASLTAAASRRGPRELLSAARRAELMCPPVSVFQPKDYADGPEPFTVHPDGTVTGHVALWGSAHISFQGRKVDVPRSVTGYAAFHGEHPDVPGGPHVLCDDGSQVNVGRLFVDTVHPDLAWSASDSFAHYADTGCSAALVRAYDTEWGLAVSGIVNPMITDEQLFTLRAHGVSGDWRPLGGNLELVGILSVNVEGFNKAIAAGGRPVGAIDGTGWRVGLAAAAGGVDGISALVGGTPSHRIRTFALAARVGHLESVLVAAGILEAPPEQPQAEVVLSADERLSAALRALGVDAESRVAELSRLLSS